jgi:hypothetical protein
VLLDKADVIHPELKPLIDALALRYPSWEIKCTRWDRWHNDEEHPAISGKEVGRYFDITQKGETLGEVWIEGYGKRRFGFNNSRIGKSMERGYGKKTGDIKKAIKEIGKWFTPASLAERVESLVEGATRELHGHTRSTRYAVSNAWTDNIERTAQHFVLGRWEEFLKYVQADTMLNQSDRTQIVKLPEAMETKSIAGYINRAHENGTASIVILENDNYIFKRKGSDEVSILSSSEVTEYMRLNIGMLKLLDSDDGVAMTPRGVKTKANCFIILDEGV